MARNLILSNPKNTKNFSIAFWFCVFLWLSSWKHFRSIFPLFSCCCLPQFMPDWNENIFFNSDVIYYHSRVACMFSHIRWMYFFAFDFRTVFKKPRYLCCKKKNRNLNLKQLQNWKFVLELLWKRNKILICFLGIKKLNSFEKTKKS